MLLFSSHYPWYYLWLLPFLSVIPYVPMLYYTTACFYLYTTQLANPGPAMYYMFEWLYATVGLVALWCLGVRLLEARLSRGRPRATQAFATYYHLRGTHEHRRKRDRDSPYGERPAEDAALFLKSRKTSSQ